MYFLRCFVDLTVRQETVTSWYCIKTRPVPSVALCVPGFNVPETLVDSGPYRVSSIILTAPCGARGTQRAADSGSVFIRQ